MRRHEPLALMDLSKIIQIIHSIPVADLTFDTTEATAQKVYGMHDEILTNPTNFGLRFTDDQHRLYSARDLFTLSLYLQLPSVLMAGIRMWPRTLRRVTEPGKAIKVSLTTSVDADKPLAEKLLIPPNWLLDESGYPEIIISNISCPRPPPPAIPKKILTLLGSYDKYCYASLPLDLMENKDLFQSGIADCKSFSFHLVAAARQKGIEARRSFGLIASVPFPSRHSWVEFRIEDQWVPIDMLMAKALNHWGVVDEEIFPYALRLGDLFVRWGDTPQEFLPQEFCPTPVVTASIIRTL